MRPGRKGLRGTGLVFWFIASVLLGVSLTQGQPERACEETIRNWPQLNAWASEGVLKPLVLLLKAC
jgi:hypothetical protein